MGREGDSKLLWDPEKPESVEQARIKFDELKRKGYLGYAVLGKGKGALIREFDPAAGEIIMAPPMAGG